MIIRRFVLLLGVNVTCHYHFTSNINTGLKPDNCHFAGDRNCFLSCYVRLNAMFMVNYMKYQEIYEVILFGDLNRTLLETRSSELDKLPKDTAEYRYFVWK